MKSHQIQLVSKKLADQLKKVPLNYEAFPNLIEIQGQARVVGVELTEIPTGNRSINSSNHESPFKTKQPYKK